MLPWLRPPQLLPAPTPAPTSSTSAEDMAKFWRRNLQQSLLAAATNKPPPGSGDPLVNFLNANNDNNTGLNPGITRSSTPNTNEPCSPPPTLMPPPYHLAGNERRPTLLGVGHSTGRIPKADPMEGQLQDMLHYNMEKCAGKYSILCRYKLCDHLMYFGGGQILLSHSMTTDQ